MSPASGNSDGGAHPVPANRLKGFESADSLEPEFRLPRRTHRAAENGSAAGGGVVVDLTDATSPDTTGPLPEGPARPSTSPPDGSATRSSSPQRPRTHRGPGRPPKAAPDPGTVGPDQRMKASNVHVPVALMPQLKDYSAKHGLANGQIIIKAIEDTYERLGDLISPAQTGGKLFASRVARPQRADAGPLTPLNYRMTEGDFAVLDRLVDELAASSRTHLIATALAAFLQRDDSA